MTQAEGSVAVEVRGSEGIKTHAGSYLIGADGGRSGVRKRCDIPFEGFTWPERFVVLTTPYDFEAARGYCYRSYFADPGGWCNCFKVSADGTIAEASVRPESNVAVCFRDHLKGSSFPKPPRPGYWALIQFLNAYWLGGGEMLRGGGVAYFAHIGGFMTGIAFILLSGDGSGRGRRGVF